MNKDRVDWGAFVSSKYLVDPELLAHVESMPQVELTHDILPRVREMSDAVAQNRQPLPDDILREERIVPGRNGDPDVRLLIYRPVEQEAGRPGIFHTHGGGFILGAPERGEAGFVSLVRELDCVVVSVAYRLSPETKFPGPMDDCYAGLSWMYQNATDLGVDPERIALAGESAGAGLAAGLCLLVRDRAEFPVLFQYLAVPMLDDRTAIREEDDPHPFTGEFGWNRQHNRFGWECYLEGAPGDRGTSKYASPARETDLSGLPPTYVLTGAMDLFLQEDTDYAMRLIRCGVPTELRIMPGAPHGALGLEGTQIGKECGRDRLRVLRRAFFG